MVSCRQLRPEKGSCHWMSGLIHGRLKERFVSDSDAYQSSEAEHLLEMPKLCHTATRARGLLVSPFLQVAYKVRRRWMMIKKERHGWREHAVCA